MLSVHKAIGKKFPSMSPSELLIVFKIKAVGPTIKTTTQTRIHSGIFRLLRILIPLSIPLTALVVNRAAHAMAMMI